MYKVIKAFSGSPDGMRVINFKEGDPFEETGDLLAVAIENKWVEETEDEAAKAAEESKAAEEAAFKKSGLTKEEWQNLADADREKRIKAAAKAK